MSKIRETVCREGWPLLTVETEVNGDPKRTNERGPFLAGALGLPCCSIRDFCSALASLVGPLQNIFSLPYNISIPLSPSHRPASWAGSRDGSPVSYCVSLVRHSPQPHYRLAMIQNVFTLPFLIQWQTIPELSKFSPVFTIPDKFY